MAGGKIIVAVDFGTTFSGVAYAFVEDGQDPRDVQVELVEDFWPGAGNQSSPKVPSVFKFDKSAPGGFKWGFQLEDDPDRICYSKLYMDPSQIEAAKALAQFSTRLGKLPPNKKPTDGITCFLASVRAVALDRMASDWGQDFVDDTPIEYILTVPAVWSDKAKSDTLFCASQAGFGDASNIRLITEPEAAAVWTFHQLPDVMVKKDDIFITVDAGGGTVDLTTYQVAATSPVLSVDEVTEGGGGLCGSAYLNRRFEELIKTKISKQLETLSKKEYGDALDEIQRAFNDDIKPDFGTTDEVGKTYFVPVPPIVADNAEAGIQDGRCAITTEEMKTVFDAVIRNILGLITDQVEKVEESHGDKEIAAILLVGGFGSSGYLRQQIEEHFDGSAMPKINVIQPVHAWSAVTRGAMLRGIQGNIVEKRIIRAAYGIAARVVWDPAVHESDKYKRAAQSLKIWDDLEQKWKCSDSMEWYVKKGESFTKEKVVKVSFYRNLSSLDNLVFKTSMITWAGNGEIPLFKNNDCRIVATLSADLSAVSKDEFKLVTSANGDYYRVDYDIEMTFEAAISFRLVFNGSIIGGLTVDYGKR